MKRLKSVYLDTAAATSLDKGVERAMRPYFRRHFANPSSIHASGVAAAKAVQGARAQIAKSLGTHADEIIFTSGGTEANNLALRGSSSKLGSHIITTVIEHASILEPLKKLSKLDEATEAVTYLPVGPDGLLDPKILVAAIKPETKLISLGYANSEIGVMQPIAEIAKVIRKFRQDNKTPFPYLHLDACQAPRFLDLNVEKLHADLLTLGSGKIYGPKGVGCLFVRRGVPLDPMLFGGGQEKGRRSGSENVPGIVGFATALTLAERLHEKESKELTILRDYFIAELLKIPGAVLNGSATNRIANNINISFKNTDAELLVLRLDAAGIACSTGSACSTHLKNESHVVFALGGELGRASSAVRFTLGRDTTKSDLKYVLKVLNKIFILFSFRA